jgi:type IV secretion system protein VirB9
MIIINIVCGAASLLAAISSFAIPAAASDSPTTTSPEIALNKERKALKLSEQWTDGNSQPILASGGKLVYVHGASQPTIIAAPMQVCDVELEPGEKINEIVIGDSARWLVESGTAGTTTHLFIKPVDTGLESSAVITTDRRTYHLKLVSQKTGFTPYVGFIYHAAIQRTAKAEAEAEIKKKEWSSTQDASGQAVDLAKLNFSYELSGDRPKWKPERVYDDGRKTYIQLPPDTRSGEMPVLHIRKGGESVLVNYRVKDATMMVDGIFDNIALVTGVGSNQAAVEIRRQK